MGLRGPKAAPSVVKFVKGETRPSRTNPDEPQLPRPTMVRPPAGLTGAGRREWQRLFPTLVDRGVLTDGDLAAFEDYCRALSDLRRYESKAARAGAEIAIAKGYAGMTVKLRTQVASLRGHLGLSPSTRSAVRATKSQVGGKLSQFWKAKHSDAKATGA